jgi:hypothetical protein
MGRCVGPRASQRRGTGPCSPESGSAEWFLAVVVTTPAHPGRADGGRAGCLADGPALRGCELGSQPSGVRRLHSWLTRTNVRFIWLALPGVVASQVSACAPRAGRGQSAPGSGAGQEWNFVYGRSFSGRPKYGSGRPGIPCTLLYESPQVSMRVRCAFGAAKGHHRRSGGRRSAGSTLQRAPRAARFDAEWSTDRHGEQRN